jgi:hypothetical protein
MTSDRPYRSARPFEDAADELIRCSGAHFDPFVVNAFTAVPLDGWREIRQLSTEPGLNMKNDKTGADIRYSVLTMSGERMAGEWGR